MRKGVAMSGHSALRRVRTEDRGAQAVEFALIFVFALVPLLLGMIQFGSMMYSQVTITQAAREAARHLSLNIINQPGCSDVTCDASKVAASQASPLTLLANPTITPCASGATQTSSATVTIKATSLLSFPLFGNFTVTGTASMPCGG